MLELYELKAYTPFLFMNDYRHLVPTIIESVCVFESLLQKVIVKGKKTVDLKVYNLSFLNL